MNTGIFAVYVCEFWSSISLHYIHQLRYDVMFQNKSITDYDIKLEKEGERPPDEWFLMNCSPSRKAEVMFRRRRP